MTREQIEHAIKCCNPYDENCGDCPFHDLPLGRCFEVLAKTAFNMLLDDRERLQKQVDEYKAKIEKGTLIELPCKVGDTIWLIVEKRWSVRKRQTFFYAQKSKLTYWNMERAINDFGKTVFLTREEAEARLKELQGDSDADDNI